jgi:hypothetical protein
MRILVEKTFTTEKKREHGEGVSYYEIRSKGICPDLSGFAGFFITSLRF